MLQAVEVRKICRTLNLELELHPLDNGEIVLGRTKKTQLILRTRTCGCHLSNSKILKMAITAASDTKLLPLFRPVVLADNLLQYEIKQETPIEIYFMGDGNIYKSDSIKNLLPFMFDKKFL
jgi:cytidine deaminase